MKVRRQHLRDCARLALEGRGLRVEGKSAQGVAPGARLRTFSGSRVSEIAVRTSLQRKVGLTRLANGMWNTIPKVDEVVVAVPSDEKPDAAEVLCFDREVIIADFNAALAAAQAAAKTKNHHPLSDKAPIFVALDSGKNVGSGLKAKAKWQTLVPFSAASVRGISQPPAAEGFLARVKREFAEINGVDVSKVVVEFRIIA
jgi:hypothetical protein